MENKDSLTIKQILKKIYKNELCVPIIQRNFVWEPEKIELLFDSILRGYPIGTMLFWHYDNKILDTFNFYTLCKYGSENRLVADEKQKIMVSLNNKIAVLDGQQRLTALYIGFCGHYMIRKKGKKRGKIENYEQKYLYIDLTNKIEIEEDQLLTVNDKIYNLQFMTEDDAKKEKKWFKLQKIYEKNNINNEINEIKKEYPDKVKIIDEIVEKLKNILETEEIIKIINIKGKKVNEVLEIFERVNSFGKPLKKTDLVFSSVVAWWPEAYDKINSLIKTINNKSNLNDVFDINYIIKTSLILVGESPIIKISSITKEIIEKIEEKWTKIEEYIIKSADLVSKMNIYNNNLTSANAIIPITYYMYKNNQAYNMKKQEFKKYLQICIMKGVYGNHSDTILRDMIQAINTGKLKEWSIKELRSLKVDGEYWYKVNKEDIETMLKHQKSDKSLFVLSILYEDKISINNETYEQDHIHPRKKFKRDIDINFPNKNEDEKDLLIIMNNSVPNLELIPQDINNDKDEKDLVDIYQNPKYNKYFKYMPNEKYYDIKKFEVFYEKRKKQLIKELKAKFKVDD